MKKAVKYILTAIVVILIVCGMVFSLLRRHSVSLIRPIPEDTVGNSAGNLRGGGLFCEYDGKVYFSNVYDDGALYVMNPDCSGMKRLIASDVSYINAGGNYLFYYMESVKGGTGLGFIRTITGLYRADLNGKNISCLDDDMLTMMVLIGDTLYFQHYDNEQFSTFQKLPAAGSEEETVLSKDIIETACAADGNLYYGGISNDHYLYAWDTETDTPRVIWEGNVSYPTIVGNYVYYMDIDYDYRLFRYDMVSGETLPMTQERIDFYNICGNVIFYQTSSTPTPALMRMNIDGSGAETISEGTYRHINTTSVYTYFQPYDEDDSMYRTSTFGPVSVELFTEAMQAAAENQEE